MTRIKELFILLVNVSAGRLRWPSCGNALAGVLRRCPHPYGYIQQPAAMGGEAGVLPAALAQNIT